MCADVRDCTSRKPACFLGIMLKKRTVLRGPGCHDVALYQHRDRGDVARAPGGSMKAAITCYAPHERVRLLPDVDADRAMDTEYPISDLATQGTFGYNRIKPDRRVGGGTYVGIERRQRH